MFFSSSLCLTYFFAQLPLRNRALAQRAKADENATSRHIRQPSASGPSGLARLAQKDIIGLKQNQARTVLNEVTTTAVNRKVRFNHVRHRPGG